MATDERESEAQVSQVISDGGSGIGSSVRRAGASLRTSVSGWPWAWQAAAALVTATLVARMPGLVHRGLFDGDEASIDVMGRVMTGGGRLYVDVIDRKPPLVPGLFGLLHGLVPDLRLVRVLCALGILANGAVVALLVRRLGDHRELAAPRGAERLARAAIVAGVLAVVGTSLFLPADAQAANFELWGLLPASAAVLCAVVGRTASRAWLWFVLAAALGAVAANCKQPYLAVLVPIGLEVLRSQRRARNAVAVIVGLVVATLPLALVVELGALLRWGWTDNGDYLAGQSALHAAAVGVAVTALFLACHLPFAYGAWAAITRRVRVDVTLVVWIAASAVVVTLGFRFFAHYYQQLVPPLAVLTGAALVGAPRLAWRFVLVTAAASTAVLVGVAALGGPPVSDVSTIAAYVHGTTSSTDRILVWGTRPDIYTAADREPSGVFLHDGYLTGAWADRAEPVSPALASQQPYRSRWTTFLADLDAHPPELVVDASSLSLDWGDHPPSAYPVGRVLERCYHQEAVVQGLPVWRRDPAGCRPG